MALPDFLSQDPATYKANIDSSLAGIDGKIGGTTSGDILTIDDAQAITNKTINGVTAYGLVILDEPEYLHYSTSYASATWYASSAMSFGSTTLAIAGAKKAIIRAYQYVSSTTTLLTNTVHIRKKGSASGLSNFGNALIGSSASDTTSQLLKLACVGEGVVNLDGSSEFEWAVNNPVTGVAIQFHLVGYYV